MTAYALGQILIKDAALWAQYRAQVPATLPPFGGELVFRAERRATFAGQSPHTDIVLIQFPNLAAANEWFASPAYQALITLREAAADVLLQAYEA